MEENNLNSNNTNSKRGFKRYLYITLLVLLLILGGYVYFKVSQFKKLRTEAEKVIEENARLREVESRYSKVEKLLNDEKQKCEDLLIKEEGNFAKFSYCQNFLELTEKINNL